MLHEHDTDTQNLPDLTIPSVTPNFLIPGASGLPGCLLAIFFSYTTTISGKRPQPADRSCG